MKIKDKGLFLYSKKFAENSQILYILSRENGLVKGLSRLKKNNNLITFDKVIFTWSSRSQNALGYINFEQETSNNLNNYFFSIIKASMSELCMIFLPPWEKNLQIYNDSIQLALFESKEDCILVKEYIKWEINFLKNIGYGFNLETCSVSGKINDNHFISPKTGNAVCFEVGKKYSKKLFKIPFCMKDNFKADIYSDYHEAMKITGYFLLKILEKNKKKFIFRNRIIEKISNL